MMLRMILVMLVMMLVMILMVLVMMLLILVMMLLMLVMMVRRAYSASARGADIQDMPCTGIRVRTQLHFILCQIFRYIHILSDFPDIFYMTPYNLIGISIVSSSDAKNIVQDPGKWKAHFCVSAPHFLVYDNHRDLTDDEKWDQAAKRKLHIFHQYWHFNS